MNIKSTDMERNRFDYKDDPKCTRDMREMFLFTFFGLIAVTFLISWALNNSDKIDLFFQDVYKWMAL